MTPLKIYKASDVSQEDLSHCIRRVECATILVENVDVYSNPSQLTNGREAILDIYE